MRHAIVGAGGIGGLLGAALARAGASVVFIMRPQTLADYQGQVAVQSVVLGDFVVRVGAAAAVENEVDVVWVSTKATQLERALELAPSERVGYATVIPLLNGVDHVPILRRRYPNVVAGAIRVESERLTGARIRQTSPFLRVELAGADAVAAELRQAGIDCRIRDDELSLLWDKLAFLAPIALATAAFAAPLGVVRGHSRYLGCQSEVFAVGRAEGAYIDEEGLRALGGTAPADMRSSMQKDVAAGREPELDAIAGPILRGGRRHGLPVPNTEELARLVARRMESS